MAIEVLLFLGSVAGALADPLYLFLFLIAGVWPRRYRHMLLAVLGVGAVLGLVFAARNWSLWIDFGQDPLALSIEGLAVRLLAALIVGHIAFGLALLVRRWIASRRLARS